MACPYDTIEAPTKQPADFFLTLGCRKPATDCLGPGDMSSRNTKYLFVSVPSSVAPSGHKDNAIQAVQTAANENYGTVQALTIPDLKVGTLDALLQQSEDLGKLEALCRGVVSKVGDTLKNILDGDESKMAQHKSVNDKPLDQYLNSFSWNKVKYRADKPISELIDLFQKEANSIDNDVRSKFNQYNSTRTNLKNLTNKQSGNLATKSLTSIVSPDLLITDSDYLDTHLIVISSSNTKDFLKSYETLAPMVVPRSAYFISSDSEYSLYAVTTFKKYSQEFLHKCREKKWTPRDFQHKEGGAEEEKKELERVQADEKRLWGEALRLGRTGWSEGVMLLVHVLILRVFVETVLRYGLPLDFVATLIKTTSKQAQRVRKNMDTQFAYLAGNALGTDKKGRPQKDDSNMSAEMQASGQGGDGNEWSPYVCFELELE